LREIVAVRAVMVNANSILMKRARTLAN